MIYNFGPRPPRQQQPAVLTLFPQFRAKAAQIALQMDPTKEDFDNLGGQDPKLLKMDPK